MEMSSSTRPLIHEVIPYIDVLTQHVDDFQDDENLMPAVRAAAKRGRIMLNKYYEFTDETSIYRIAMSKSTPLGNNDERPLTFAA